MFRRQKGLRQKPWNKPNKMDMFWSVDTNTRNSLTGDNGIYSMTGGTSVPIIIVDLNAATLSESLVDSVASGAQGNCKLHRFDGQIMTWLGQGAEDGYRFATGQKSNGASSGAPTFGFDVPTNLQMLSYVWLRVKEGWEVPATPQVTEEPGGPAGAAGTYAPKLNVLSNMLIRDDIIKWGNIPVWGPSPMMYNVTGGATIQMNMGVPNQWVGGGVNRVPFPRLPKAGLNMRKGERLLCVVSAWDPCSINTTDLGDNLLKRTVNIVPIFRSRVSRA